jgi:tetratricopeptide (TPR) repeat protein
LKEAEGAFRDAIRFKVPFPYEACCNLGVVLNRQGRHKEAEAAHRKAIRLKPDYAAAHDKLGTALYDQRRYQESEEAYREAIRLKPDYALAHRNLGHTLRNQGRFADAIESFRRADALGRKGPARSSPSIWVRRCERLVELNRKLTAILRGDAEPTNTAERIEFATLCRYKRLYAAATRLSADAFAADPKLAEDWSGGKRYDAACCAALAAAGQGNDAKLLPDKVTLMLRRQALRWLHADLVRYREIVAGDKAALWRAVEKKMRVWQQAADLASVRDKAALHKLPDEERQAWRRLWDEVAALLKKVEAKK